MSTINLYHGDCLEAMRSMPDKCYDLALVDPEYGLNKKITGGRFAKFGNKQLEWDKSIPSDQYFIELERVSKNRIIWGANYFPYLWQYGCRGFIFWDKNMTVDNYSAGELAYSSFDTGAKVARIEYNGFLGKDKDRIHATQKPIALYKWLLENYAKPGDKILDTHGGSMSIAIACYDLGFDLDLWEIDEDYYKAGKERFDKHVLYYEKGIKQIGNVIQQSLFSA